MLIFGDNRINSLDGLPNLGHQSIKWQPPSRNQGNEQSGPEVKRAGSLQKSRKERAGGEINKVVKNEKKHGICLL